jgi:hypothetical protein
MTQELFKQLVARPRDTIQVGQELRFGPFWTNATCSIAMEFQDGRVSNEECKQTARTVDGKYIVFDLDSQFYHQVIHTTITSVPHPDPLPALARLIIEASERTQLWVVTHSPVLVAALQENSETPRHRIGKGFGQAQIKGQHLNLLDRPQWRWAE